MKYILLFAFVAFFQFSQGQTLVDSNLPIVLITTDGGTEIPKEPRINGDMKIIYRGDGERTFVSDQNNEEYLDYNGRIEIETRGSSSDVLDKKQYAFSTLEPDDSDTDNVSLLGMPKENDWIFNGLAFDASLMRDYICYNLSRQIGEYASRTKYCEIVINGDYRGVYILQEKIKADGDRVDINKIDPTDNDLPNISGGYITKIDRPDPGLAPAWEMSVRVGNSATFVHEVPKAREATGQQTVYLQGEFDKLADRSASKISSFSAGYPAVIDVKSFIDFMLINELSSNVDAYVLSTFFHKDRNGKLRAGPIWDLNLTFGNDLYFWGLDRSHTDVWQFDNNDNVGPLFWKDLFDDPQFNCHMAKRWEELTAPGQPLSLANLESMIDETAALLTEVVPREDQRWGTMGSHASEINTIKLWISDRINWMNENIGSSAACSNTVTPSLVITKINYRPSTVSSPSSSDQEFIEILNNGFETVNLTGVYFGGTGLVYQFPIGSSVEAGQSLVLANSAITYELKYGESAFDEYSRSLSNDGQTISLLDGFGNTIDEVTYNDQLPWPVEADGDGYFLELVDPNSDNSDPANWVATQDVDFTLSTNEELSRGGIDIYPNPVRDVLKVSSSNTIFSVGVLDVQGRYLRIEGVYKNDYLVNLEGYNPGIYFVEVITREGKSTHRVVKQ